MIAVCNEKDCPLHPDNGWRDENLKSLEKSLETLKKEVLNIKLFEAITQAIIARSETTNIPSNCYTCKYMKPIDMKKEFIIKLAKNKLLK